MPKLMTMGTHWHILSSVEIFRRNDAKNAQLKRERGVGFEEVIAAIERGGLLDMLKHRNAARYPRWPILVVALGNYSYLVPFVEETRGYFLKTIIPSRKATRDYLKTGVSDA
jgi:hypothetical protein